MSDARTGAGSNGAALLFDFGGTLDGDGVPWPRRFFDAYRRAGGVLGFPDFEPLFRDTDRDLSAWPGIHAMGFRASIAAQAALLIERLPDGATVDVVRVIDTLDHDARAIVARNRPMIERLARRYRLGVVSNFTGNLEPCLAELGLRPFFDVVADSGVLGIAKPAVEIFTHALAALGVAPEGAWMVGDNLEADLRPAQRLGMRTCWLAPPDRPAPEGFAPTARIGRLTDFERVLG